MSFFRKVLTSLGSSASSQTEASLEDRMLARRIPAHMRNKLTHAQQEVYADTYDTAFRAAPKELSKGERRAHAHKEALLQTRHVGRSRISNRYGLKR